VKLVEIASLVNGEIIGNRNIEITGVSDLTDAKSGDITYISSKRYIKDLSKCEASCVIVSEPIANTVLTQLKVSNPRLAFAKLLEYFYIKPNKPLGISKDASVSDKAKIDNDVSIFPFSYISEGASIGEETVIYPFVYIGEKSVIGKRCILYPNVTVREGVKIGNGVIVHSGTVIGSDGFGYVFDKDKYYKIPHVGGVIIGDNVEIGSNVSIDRATIGNTIIGEGSKIDNLVQIAHNVKIGNHSIIVAQVGVGGSTEIGDFVTLAGQVGVSDHTKIDSQTVIGAQSGVMGNVSRGNYFGTPAISHREWLKAYAIFAKLPELKKELRELQAKIRELERRIPNDGDKRDSGSSSP